MVDEIVGSVKLKADSSEAEAAAKRTEAAFTKAVWTSRDNAKLALFDFKKGFAVAMEEAKAKWEPAKLGALAFNAAIGAGAVALGAFTLVMKQGIEISLERMRVEDLLRQSLANRGMLEDGAVEKLKAHADAMERLTGFESEDVQQGMALALNLGVRAENMDALTQAAARMARVTQTDYQTAMEALVKSLEGQGMQLSRLFPKMKDFTEEQFRSGAAVNYMNQELENSLAKTDDMRGGITDLGNAWEDARAKLGDSVTKNETLVGAVNLLATVLDNADKGLLAIKWTLLALPAAMGEVKDAAEGLGKSIGGALGDWMTEGTEINVPDLYGAAPVVGGRVSESTKTVNLLGEWKAKGYTGAAKAGKKKPGEMRDLENETWSTGDDFAAEQEKQRADEAEAYAKHLDDLTAVEEKKKAERYEVMKQLDADYSDWKKELADKDLAYAIAKDEERAESQKWLMDTMLGAAEGFTSAGVGLLMDLAGASGEQQAAILKSFLSSTGEQLIGSGIRYGFEATAELISSYGASPKGWALAATSAAMIAGGAAMMGGSTAIQLPSSGGGGAPGATATGGASPSSSVGPGQAAPQNTTVIIYGEPSARLGVLIRDSLNQANNRGV